MIKVKKLCIKKYLYLILFIRKYIFKALAYSPNTHVFNCFQTINMLANEACHYTAHSLKKKSDLENN